MIHNKDQKIDKFIAGGTKCRFPMYVDNYREHIQAKTVKIEGEQGSFVLKTVDFLLLESRIGVKSTFHFPLLAFHFPLSTFSFPNKLSSSCPKNGLKQNDHSPSKRNWIPGAESHITTSTK